MAPLKIAFIGIGQMGREMCGNLLDSGKYMKAHVRANGAECALIGSSKVGWFPRSVRAGGRSVRGNLQIVLALFCAWIGRTCLSLLPVHHQPVSQKCEGKMFHDCPQNC